MLVIVGTFFGYFDDLVIKIEFLRSWASFWSGQIEFSYNFEFNLSSSNIRRRTCLHAKYSTFSHFYSSFHHQYCLNIIGTCYVSITYFPVQNLVKKFLFELYFSRNSPWYLQMSFQWSFLRFCHVRWLYISNIRHRIASIAQSQGICTIKFLNSAVNSFYLKN